MIKTDVVMMCRLAMGSLQTSLQLFGNIEEGEEADEVAVILKTGFQTLPEH